jgi:two-component system response regulator YesN
MKRDYLRNSLKENSEHIRNIRAFVRTTRIPIRLFDSKGVILWESDFFKGKSNFCKIVQSNGFPGRTCLKSHKEIVRESLRWGEPIISKCCYFIMQIVAPVIEKGRLTGNLVASPFLLINPSELQPEELVPFLRVKSERTQNLKKALSLIPIVKDEEARQATQRLFQLADRLSDPDLSALIKVQEAQILQGKIADQIRDLKDLDREFTPDSLSKLFYDQEKEIVTKTRLGDHTGAKEILCQLLAIILVQYLENFELLKISILELLIILSRAAVEAGVKIEEMLGMRYGFVTELSRIRDQEELCLWIVKILEKITGQIYQTRNANNYQRLRKAMDFIDAHCDEPLTVEQIAKEVYLSASRLSHIIKGELGMTLGDYISRVRIDKAKGLLREKDLPLSQVAQEVGFSDQSYFTKVFKKVERCTPRAYRITLFQTQIGS